MAELKDVMAYICSTYRNKADLSKARLTKLVYLADWRSALLSGQQMTAIQWYFNHFGPYVDDVIRTARGDDDFVVTYEKTVYDDPKSIIELRGKAGWASLTTEDLAVLDHVIGITQELSWDKFIRLVYSTYPVLSQPRHSYLKLPELAVDFSRQPAASLA